MTKIANSTSLSKHEAIITEPPIVRRVHLTHYADQFLLTQHFSTPHVQFLPMDITGISGFPNMFASCEIVRPEWLTNPKSIKAAW